MANWTSSSSDTRLPLLSAEVLAGAGTTVAKVRAFGARGSGVSRTHPTDAFDEHAGELIALGRALQSLGRRLERRGLGLAKHRQDIRTARAGKARRAVASSPPPLRVGDRVLVLTDCRSATGKPVTRGRRGRVDGFSTFSGASYANVRLEADPDHAEPYPVLRHLPLHALEVVR